MLKINAVFFFIVAILLLGCQTTVAEMDLPPYPDEVEVSQPSIEPFESNSGDAVTVVPPEVNTPLPTVQAAVVTITPEVIATLPEQLPATNTSENDEGEMMEPTTADADVEFVRARLSSDGSWTFSVTVRHPDTGWEDYANGWDVITLDGTVLKLKTEDQFTRLLLHPHETEQPFTRSQSGIIIPEGISQVIVRAHDLVDGFGGQEITVDLSTPSGPGYEVERP